MKNIIILLTICSIMVTEIYAQPKVKFNGNTVELENGDLHILFENDIKLRLLNMSQAGKTWNIANNDLIWKLSVAGNQGQKLTLTSQTSTYKGAQEVSGSGEKSLVFSWEYLLGSLTANIDVTVAVNDQNKLSQWKIKASLPSGWKVAETTFPIVTLPKSNDSRLILPSGWGVEYDLSAITNSTYINNYPSSRGTMQLVSFYENNNVFYYATHDSGAALKAFTSKVTSANVEISNQVVSAATWNNNGQFELPWATSIGLTDKGWEDAVLTWYRPFSFQAQWGQKKLVEKNHPSWLINSDLWLTGGHANEKELDITKKSIDMFGNQTSFHWYYWHNYDFDTKYPEYLPAKEGFSTIIDTVQARGAHIMPYINGRLWDTTTVSYQSQGGNLAVVLKEDKTPVIEVYASKAPNAVICPSSAVWKSILVNLTDNIQGDVLGTDALYFDQVASARGHACFNENHNHPVGGGTFWVDNYREIFKEVRKKLRPGHIIATEQNAEAYLDMFDLFLMANYPQGTVYKPLPLFPLVYSDRALLYGFYIYNKNDMSYRVKNALNLLWGAQLNGGRTSFLITCAMKANAGFLSGLVNFRKQHHDIFVGGRMLKEITPSGDNPILNIPNWGESSAAVRGALWENQNGSKSILLVNIDTASHAVMLPDSNQQVVINGGECKRINL